MSFLNILEEFMTKLRIRVIYCHFNIKLGITMSLKDNTKNNNADQIETRHASLGLKLPEPLKVPPDIQTPFAFPEESGLDYILEKKRYSRNLLIAGNIR
jgi:hypothetical protein